MTHGPAVWASAAWREEALAWARAHGVEPIGPEEQRIRPWATVLRIPTADGAVWLKASGPGTAYEVRLYPFLVEHVPRRVLRPLASDPGRGWLLLPDGGPLLSDRGDDAAVLAGFTDALVQYGQLQRDLTGSADAMVALGVPDMRPEVMPRRFDEALAAVEAAPNVAAMRGTYVEWCERLAASPIPASLDHNDLYPMNVLDDGSGTVRFYDWGDSSVAHPFAAVFTALGVVRHDLGTHGRDPRVLAVRDAYLGVFADVAPHAELVATLELACRVAKVARALTWERAMRAVRESGEPVDEDWATAPLFYLSAVLQASYLSEPD